MKSVLVVEDEPHVREAYALALRGKGYAVVEAERAAAGLQLAEDLRPDLILLDVIMPEGEMDGIEFLARFHERCPPLDIPVLIVSGLGLNIDRGVAARLGVRGIVPKPVLLADLMREIQRILAGSERRDRANESDEAEC